MKIVAIVIGVVGIIVGVIVTIKTGTPVKLVIRAYDAVVDFIGKIKGFGKRRYTEMYR